MGGFEVIFGRCLRSLNQKKKKERERLIYLSAEEQESFEDEWMDGDDRYKALPSPQRDATKTQSGKGQGLVLTLMCECHLVVCLELHLGLVLLGNFIP